HVVAGAGHAALMVVVIGVGVEMVAVAVVATLMIVVVLHHGGVVLLRPLLLRAGMLHMVHMLHARAIGPAAHGPLIGIQVGILGRHGGGRIALAAIVAVVMVVVLRQCRGCREQRQEGGGNRQFSHVKFLSETPVRFNPSMPPWFHCPGRMAQGA